MGDLEFAIENRNNTKTSPMDIIHDIVWNVETHDAESLNLSNREALRLKFRFTKVWISIFRLSEDAHFVGIRKFLAKCLPYCLPKCVVLKFNKNRKQCSSKILNSVSEDAFIVFFSRRMFKSGSLNLTLDPTLDRTAVDNLKVAFNRKNTLNSLFNSTLK